MKSRIKVSTKSRVEVSTIDQRTIRMLALLILIAGLLLILLVQLFPVSRARAASNACTYTIPSHIEIVDGLGNYAQVQPGDVLCLPAGERGNIKFVNLNGTAGNPITIRNEGGKVVITGERFLTGGIGLINTTNIRVTGSGVTSKCGAPYTPEEQDCGIELSNVQKGIKVDNPAGNGKNVEIDHVYIHHTSPISDTNGIAVHPDELQMFSGFYVHHNHITNTSAEGIYVGKEPPNGVAFEELGKLENVEVSHNLVEDTGYDGIKVKVAINNVKVHHNIILNSGVKRVLAHQGGIKLAFNVGDYYNNLIIHGCEGIRMDRTIPNPGTRYFNNVVVDTECGGIEVAEENAQIYNNTIVRTGPFGIWAEHATGAVFNNIVVGVQGDPVRATGIHIFDNFIGAVADAGFVNPGANDFRLLPSSPAVDAVSPSGSFPSEDYEGNSRPMGEAADLGAFEYDPQAAPPTQPPPTEPPPTDSPFRTFLPIVSARGNP
jgi:hypothetical protein